MLNKTNSLNEKEKLNKFDIFIIILLVGIVPFLVRGLDYATPFANADGSTIEMFDYFNLIKVFVIKCAAFLIVVYETYVFFTTEKFIMFKLKYKEIITPKHIFGLVILISTIIAFLFSDYKAVALKGATERFESIWVHFSYIIIFFYSLKFFKKQDAFKYFSIAILISTFVVGLIGTLQAVGLSPYDSSAFLNLTIPGDRNVQITMPGSFTTMYNTNTSASYSLFMMYVLALVFVLNKDIKFKIISSIDFVLITITFLFSYSEGSYLALVGSICAIIIFIIITLFITNKKKTGLIATGALVAISIVSIGAIAGIDSVNTKFQTFLTKAIGEEANFTDWSQDGNDFYFYNREDDFIKVSTNINNSFEIYENENLLLTGSNDNLEKTITTENFDDVYINSFYEDNINYINFNNYFLIRNNAEPALLDIESRQTLRYVDWIGFEGYNNLFTNRGFIWSRSLPLLLDKPLGYGADTFMLYFPNDDIVGKMFCNWPMESYVDKPHSIYLNMAINNGILYLFGFIAIVFIAIIEKFKLIKNNTNVNIKAIIIYLGGLSAYLINGMSTDNIVVIIMLFWIYLAIDNCVFTETDEN